MQQVSNTNLGRPLNDEQLAAFYGAKDAVACPVTIIFHSDGSISSSMPQECQDKVKVKQK